MRLIPVARILGSLFTTVLLVSSCSVSPKKHVDDNDDDSSRWFCQESDPSDGCSCNRAAPGRQIGGSDEVEECSQYSCCLRSNERTVWVRATACSAAISSSIAPASSSSSSSSI